MSDRAKQFLPFATLKGYYDMVREAQRKVEPKRELSCDDTQKLNAKLMQVKKGSMVTLTHYAEDAYETTCGMVSNIDFIFGSITIVKTRILFADIYDISGDGINVDV